MFLNSSLLIFTIFFRLMNKIQKFQSGEAEESTVSPDVSTADPSCKRISDNKGKGIWNYLRKWTLVTDKIFLTMLKIKHFQAKIISFVLLA